MTNNNNRDDFWDLGEFKSPARQRAAEISRSFPAHRTSAVEISDVKPISEKMQIAEAETVITKFVPPHSGASFAKKHVIFEYEPQNPLIKSVTIYSEREGESLFVSDNLFIRERRALLDREVTFKE